MEISVPPPSPITMPTLPAYSERDGPDTPRAQSPFLPVPNFGNLLNSVDSLFADSTDDDMSQDSLPHLMAFWQGIAERQDANYTEPVMRAQALRRMLDQIIKRCRLNSPESLPDIPPRSLLIPVRPTAAPAANELPFSFSNSQNSSCYQHFPNLIIAIPVASPFNAPHIRFCQTCNQLREPDTICQQCKQGCFECLVCDFRFFPYQHDLFAFLSHVNTHLAYPTKAQIEEACTLHRERWSTVQDEILEFCVGLKKYKSRSTTKRDIDLPVKRDMTPDCFNPNEDATSAPDSLPDLLTRCDSDSVSSRDSSLRHDEPSWLIAD